MNEILKTSPERFADLPGFPWKAHHCDDLGGFGGLAMAYVDEGPAKAPVFLCLHGQPTWSYLYRRMIPHFLRIGSRVVAPDFFGFGRSDKPADDAAIPSTSIATASSPSSTRSISPISRWWCRTGAAFSA